MITGLVSSKLEAILTITLIAANGEQVPVKAMIDTGYNSQVSLPSKLIDSLGLPAVDFVEVTLADGSNIVARQYFGHLAWFDMVRPVIVTESPNGEPIVGMELLYGNRLSVNVIEGGAVVIESLI